MRSSAGSGLISINLQRRPFYGRCPFGEGWIISHPDENSEESKKWEARALLLKRRFFRVLALVFAAAGLILFSILYNRQYEDGGLMEALRNPLFVVTLVFPFVPSMVLLWWSGRLDKKFRVMIQELRNRKD